MSTLTVLEEIYQTRSGSRPVDAKRQRPRRAVQWDRFTPLLTVAVGIVALGVGVMQMRGTLRLPREQLQTSAGTFNPNQLAADAAGGFASALAAATDTRDTDSDGLLDADEPRFGTSAYLEDSDSDGALDGAEVDAGSDPTCPAGQTCQPSVPAATPAAGNPAAAGSLPLSATPGFGSGSANLGPAAQQLRDELLGNVLRGQAPATLLDEPLGDELGKQLQQFLPSLNSAAGAGSGTSGSPLGSLTPDKLRELLRQQGVPEEMLAQYSDEELQQIATEVSTNLSTQ